MISVVFFDIGGVLITDFISGGFREFEKVLDLPKDVIISNWLKTDSADFAIGKESDEERCKRFVREVGLPEDKIPICMDAYYKGYKLIDEIISFVEELKKTAFHIRLGILSDQATGVAEYIRKQYNYVLQLFDESLILISAEIAMSKKSKGLEIYHEAIRRAQTNPGNILYVDNSKTYIESAESLGIRGFYFDIENKELSSLISELRSLIKTS